MSVQFFETFFPSAAQAMQNYTPAIWNFAFPESSRSCHELPLKLPIWLPDPLESPEWSQHVISVVKWMHNHFLLYANVNEEMIVDPAKKEVVYIPPDYHFHVGSPTVLALAILGLSVGLSGVYYIQRQRRALRKAVLASDKESYYGDDVWWPYSWACFLFAMMNLSAVFAHSFITPSLRHIRTLPEVWESEVGYEIRFIFVLLETMDVACTAASSSSLLFAFMTPRQFVTTKFARFVLYSWVAICFYLSYRGNFFELPWYNELLYIGITLLAAIAGLLFMVLPTFLRPLSKKDFVRRGFQMRQKRAIVYVMLAFVLIVLALVTDPFVCGLVGGKLNMVSLLFLGCDLAMLGSSIWAVANIEEAVKMVRKEQGKKE
ncbi:hypothetical protein BJ742DRAFT_783102 [Cladochytrium replicatum]|nr:hypothetical protein BJ742DRAFT_783102 [Cladochytrium replicatum]